MSDNYEIKIGDLRDQIEELESENKKLRKRIAWHISEESQQERADKLAEALEASNEKLQEL